MINFLTIQPRSQMLSGLHLDPELYLNQAKTILSLAKCRFVPLGLTISKKKKKSHINNVI